MREVSGGEIARDSNTAKESHLDRLRPSRTMADQGRSLNCASRTE
jgi:hypothetical protein